MPADRLARAAGRYALASGAALVARVEGRGLVAGAEGQEAVDLRAGAAPDSGRHRAERELAARIEAGLARGDVSLVREKVVEALWSKTSPDRLAGSIWPRHVEKRGALRGSEEIGARAEGAAGVRVWVRPRHERGDAAAEFVLTGGRLAILDLGGREFPLRAAYLPVARTRFAACDFGRPAPPPIEFAAGADAGADELRLRLVQRGDAAASVVVGRRAAAAK